MARKESVANNCGHPLIRSGLCLGDNPLKLAGYALIASGVDSGGIEVRAQQAYVRDIMHLNGEL